MKQCVQRLFIALAVSEDARSKIASAQSELRELLPPGIVRWVSPTQFHITLKFLGNVSVERIQELVACLGKVCAQLSSVNVRVRGLGCFPDKCSPRVLWAGLEKPAELSALQKEINHATAGFSQPDRHGVFTGHITIGRVRDFKELRSDAFEPYLKSQQAREFGAWKVNVVDLMQSELSPSGATHENVARVPLLAQRLD